MGTIPSRREDRGLTPLRPRAWISVSAAAYFWFERLSVGFHGSDGLWLHDVSRSDAIDASLPSLAVI